jgi:hypothetical protein
VRENPDRDDTPLRASAASEGEGPLHPNVRRFPFIIGPEVVLEIALRQRERATEKAVARHDPRKRRRDMGSLGGVG